MEQGLYEKTGKTLDEWIRIVQAKNFAKHGEILAYLKGEEHGLTHGFANFISLKSRKSDAGSKDDNALLEAQYSKGKEHLKPIYDLLVSKIADFGEDIEFVPKNANVSCRRKKQFALIQPSTKTRMDIGLKFKDKPHTDRLESSGPFGAMCSHRVQLTDVGQVDDELIGWIKEAYEGAG